MADIRVGKGLYAPDQVLAKAKSARSWLLAIVVLSFVNSLALACGAKLTFLIGLASTLIVDGLVLGMRQHYPGAASVFLIVGFAINMVPLGIYLLIWGLSGRGSSVAYAIGIGLYALDALIMLLFRDWLSALFHVYALACLMRGYPFVNAYHRARVALMRPDQTYANVPAATFQAAAPSEPVASTMGGDRR